MRYRVYYDDDGQVDIEVVNKQPFIHVSFTRWSSRVARKAVAIQDCIETLLRMGGARVVLAEFRPDQILGIKFAKRFGFKHLQTLSNEHLIMGKRLDEPMRIEV